MDIFGCGMAAAQLRLRAGNTRRICPDLGQRLDFAMTMRHFRCLSRWRYGRIASAPDKIDIVGVIVTLIDIGPVQADRRRQESPVPREQAE